MILKNLRNAIAKKLGAVAVSAACMLPALGILAGGLAFVGQTHAVEMVVNGGFEMNNGFNADNSGFGWTTVDGSDTTLGFDVYSHTSQVYYDGPAPAGSGEWYFHTVGLGSLFDVPAIVEQTIDVTGMDDMPYTFSAQIAGFVAGGDTAMLELEFDNAGVTSILDGTTGGADGITNTWDLFSATGTIPTGATTATVRILQATAGASNGNDNYVDLVSLNVVPEPAAFGLLGLGGLMLTQLRKRD